jgi:hypothetical protein
MQTEVELRWVEGQIERWLRFGQPASERIIDRRRRVVGFAPGAMFALVRWQANDFGTAASRIDILRAVAHREAFSTVPFVAPGGELFLHIGGWPKVQRVLEAIDAVEQAGVDPCEAAPEHWRHVASRLEAGQAPRPYTPARHRAWRLRRRFWS